MNYIGNIYRKLHVNNRVDAVREAMRIRLVEPPAKPPGGCGLSC